MMRAVVASDDHYFSHDTFSRRNPMANRVIVAMFQTQNQAYDAAAAMQRLDDNGMIELKRGAIATKDAKGNLTIPDSKHVGSAWGLLGGGLIGAVLGAMLGQGPPALLAGGPWPYTV
jgi:uncharacterized membrane protein